MRRDAKHAVLRTAMGDDIELCRCTGQPDVISGNREFPVEFVGQSLEARDCAPLSLRRRAPVGPVATLVRNPWDRSTVAWNAAVRHGPDPPPADRPGVGLTEGGRCRGLLKTLVGQNR